jgi:ribosomal protein S18 acetylase RimI-like enzyme
VAAVEYFVSGGSESRAHLGAMVTLYAEVFAEQPYNEGARHVRRFRRWCRSELRKPAFSLVRAVRGGVLVGMAYGYTMPAGEWWHNAVDDGPAAVVAAEKFVIMEWAVRAPDRGQGIGRQLMSRLMEDRAEPYATLNVLPNTAAHAIYLKQGWVPAGETKAGLHPAMRILFLPLNDRAGGQWP